MSEGSWNCRRAETLVVRQPALSIRDDRIVKDLGCSVEIELELSIWLSGWMNRDETSSGLSILRDVK